MTAVEAARKIMSFYPEESAAHIALRDLLAEIDAGVWLDTRESNSVWLLMAQDGRRDCFELWAPIQVFLHQPTTLEVGRVLVANLPDWPDHPWVDADRPRRIMDFCQVIRVRVRAAREAADA